MKLTNLLRALFALWCFLILLFAIRLYHSGFLLATDLTDLFPRSTQDRVVLQVNDQLQQTFGNNIILAVEAENKNAALRAMQKVIKAVDASADLQVVDDINADAQRLSQQQNLLAKYRYSLLTPDQARELTENNTDAIIARAQQALLGFGGMRSSLSPLEDPLALTAGLMAQLQPPLNAELVDNFLVFHDNNTVIAMLLAQLTQASFKLDTQRRIKAWKQNLEHSVSADGAAKLLVSGIVFHAAQASANANREISTIGLGSCLGVLLLFWFAFRSFKPLLLSLSSVAFGCFCAVVVTHTIFAEIHLLTLVFGASLIGVAIDYALHFLCKCQLSKGGGAHGSSYQTLKNILPSLSLGLFTSGLGYSCLLQAELPGLQQVAVFSMVGLASAWLFVTVVLPYFVKQSLAASGGWLAGITCTLWQLWFKAPRFVLFAIACICITFSFLGVAQSSLSSDARTLYKPSETLMAAEKRLQHHLQAVASNQYFLLRASSAEQLLQLEERFRQEHLDRWVTEGVIDGYSATSRWVPSLATQNRYYALQKNTLYSAEGAVERFMLSVGFPVDAVQSIQSHFLLSEQARLPLSEWLAVASQEQKMLWLGKVPNGDKAAADSYVSLITLQAIHQLPVIARSEFMDGVTWVDRVAQMSDKLDALMHAALQLLCVAYGLIALSLLLLYRRWRAVFMVLLPLASSVFVVALLSFFAVPLNLFHILASFLLLGLGMDYSIFAYSGGQGASTQRAVFLSAITSILSFGLLALSATPMIQAFGVTLLLGSSFNLLFAPLITVLAKNQRHS